MRYLSLAAALVKGCHLPAPWLLGSMIGVAGAQTIGSVLAGHNLVIWWPHGLMIIAQLLIGSSVGASLRRTMFAGLVRTLFVGLLSSIGLILSMFLCALLVAKTTGLDLMTAVLAFSPGGIAEMATTSVVLGAESTFVVEFKCSGSSPSA
ncbi:AbrB family transcriptional regulator [Terrilactibacillus sp. S3-3]|nr:AbrB family transcriptional regulator [Terrilactibacillus sp. S3-3]